PDDVKPGADPLAEQVDKMLGGRTGAEAKPHAVAHLFERTRRRLPFELFHIHAQGLCFVGNRCRSSDRRWGSPRAYLASFYRKEQYYTPGLAVIDHFPTAGAAHLHDRAGNASD